MSDDQFRYILQYAHQIEWPSNREILPGSQAVYERGLDLLNTYRGDPAVLTEALRVFHSTNVLPYALAGLAATLSLSSYNISSTYDTAGLAEALRWLNTAQAMAPDRLEVNFLEAQIAIQGSQIEIARKLLDNLARNPLAPKYYFYCTTEFAYWDRLGNLQKVQFWYDQIMAAETNSMQHYYARHIFTAFYFNNRLYLDYIRLAQELSRISPGDPWLWHNLSIAHYQLKQFPEAEYCNQRSLALLNFGAAQDMRELIKRR